VEVPVAPIVRESRGNITLEGPSGMFLNPTSATLPQGVFSIGYCAVLTNQKTDVLGHSMYISYGVRDWLELGVVANMFNFSIPGDDVPAGDYVTGGPMARIRLIRDRNCWPEISIGGYAKIGTEAFDSKNAFIAASKTVPIDEKGFLKTVTFQGGFRESWLEAPNRETNRFYGGLEVQLPYNFYLVGEITQFAKEKDQFTPWAAGIQWRGKRFGLSAAFVQSGDDSPPSIYLGIGSGLGAEPVRTPTRPTSRP
jgi:Exopolysaccharide biosynthesis protein YbjH